MLKKVFTAWFKLIIREINFIVADKSLLMMLLIAPLFYSFFYASIYAGKVETEIPIVVVDADNTNLSRLFTRKVDATQTLSVNKVVADMNEAKDLILRGEAQAALLLPKDFEVERKRNKQTTLKLYINTTRFLVYNDIRKAVNEVAFNYGNEVKEKTFLSKGYTLKQTEGLVEPLSLDTRFLFNPFSAYGNFILPAIILLIIQQTLLIGVAQSIAKENETDKYKELKEKSLGSGILTVLGKQTFYIFSFTILSLFFFSVNFNLFNITLLGRRFDIVILTILFIASTSLAGLFLGSLLPKKIYALQILAFGSYPLFFVTGYSYPLDQMPEALRLMSRLIPAGPYVEAFTNVALMGSGLNAVTGQMLNLIGLTVFFFILNVIRFKFFAYNKAE